MRNRIPNLLLPVALLLLAGRPASAAEQVPQSSFVDRVDVEIVNVEVFVTDRAGRRVSGLGKEDFELYEDGERVEVTNFYALERPPAAGREPVTAATGETRAVADPRQVPEQQQLFLMVFFDHFNIRPNHRQPILKALGKFLDERLAHQDRVMLVASGGALEVVQPFTADRQLIAEGLKRLGQTVTRRSEQETADHFATRWDLMDTLAGADTGNIHTVGRIQEARLVVQHSAARLEHAVRLLGVQPGRKAMVYVSDGLPPQGMDDSAQQLLRGVGRTANAHLVTFYALDARGVRDSSLSAEQDRVEAGGDLRTVIETNRDWNVEQPLFLMSAPTGGAVASGSSNFAKSLRKLGEDFDTFYSLGYAARRPGDGEYHKIDVKLRRRGLSVRHRSGYLARPPADRVADRFLASLVLDDKSNPLGIQLTLGAAEKSGSEEYELPLLVRIPSGTVTFLRGDEMMEARLRIYLAVQDEKGRLSLVQDLPYPLRVPLGEMEEVPGGDVGYQTKLRIGPGSQIVAVGVWDEISGAESFVHQAVVVGDVN